MLNEMEEKKHTEYNRICACVRACECIWMNVCISIGRCTAIHAINE